MKDNNRDRAILRALASEYAEAAHDPVNAKRRTVRRAVNDLNPIRPAALIHEIPWGEFADEPELALRCEGEAERACESMLRQSLFQWRHFPGDMVLDPYFPVRKRLHYGDSGLDADEAIIKHTSGTHIMAHEYHDQFAQDDDLKKLRFKTVTYDQTATMDALTQAAGFFGTILPVKLCGVAVGYANFWDDISRYRGVTPLLHDLIDRPEFSHAMVGRIADIFLDTLRQLEELDLLDPYAQTIHCTPAENSILRFTAGNDGRVTPSQLWGRGTAQIFATVSPAMHDEFDIQYMVRALAPFGLNYYGCCEPLHDKIGILEKIPNLRKIGITPWANPDTAAERMGSRYVMSFKPNPAFVAAPGGIEAARAELKRAVNAAQRNGTPIDIVLKDISTVGGDWRRLAEWEAMVMAEIT